MASDSSVSALLVGDGLETIALQVIAETNPVAKVMNIAHARIGKEMSRYCKASLDDPFYTVYTSVSLTKRTSRVDCY